MNTRKRIFRPSWLLNVGPGVIWALLISGPILAAAANDLVPDRAALWLHIIPVSILLRFHLRWLRMGYVTVTRDRVIFRGWMHRVDQDGSHRHLYTQKHIPRAEWSSITTEGLIYPTVSWHCLGETVTLEHVTRARLLQRLLFASESEFDQAPSPSALILVLIGLARTLQAIGALAWRLGVALFAGTVWLARWGWPHLRRAAHWMVRSIRQHIQERQTRAQAPQTSLPLPTPEYRQFVRFCREHLFDGDPSFQVDMGDFYREILEQARIISKRPNGYGLGALHPRIQCIDDITRRITFEAFEWRLLEHHIVSGLGELPLHDEVLVPSALN